ncbi:MAG: glycogen-binding domain-containing protein [Flavisolibacter sp.]
MEIMKTIYAWLMRLACVLVFSIMTLSGHAQEKLYTIKDGKMYIQLSKKIGEAELDSFINSFELADLDLKRFLKTGNADSLVKLGWKINVNNEIGIVISKSLVAIDNIINPGNKIIFSNDHPDFSQVFPAVSHAVTSGNNRFRNKHPFLQRDSIVRFFLKGNDRADRVMLAGSFNNWSPDSLAMTRTDSGWIADVVLHPGKYWYKFIADGNWMTDRDNQLTENDGKGNQNSIFFFTNTVFRLEGFTKAKQAYVAGSFNNWRPKELAMKKTETGWELPLYLADGTHPYKFIVDGKWYTDEKNPNQLPDGNGAFNSVISIGEPYNFSLNGYENAEQVFLVGSFNDWREFELPMQKTPTGWKLPYVLGPGNHEYKFKVDKTWISDPENPVKVRDNNSYLVVSPNYTFRLKGFADAKKVFLSGDFNGWSPDGLAMIKDGDEWVFSLYVTPGKVRYKFVVDGNWILDPSNKLWEQNEYGTGNSIVWIEK